MTNRTAHLLTQAERDHARQVVKGLWTRIDTLRGEQALAAEVAQLLALEAQLDTQLLHCIYPEKLDAAARQQVVDRTLALIAQAEGVAA